MPLRYSLPLIFLLVVLLTLVPPEVASADDVGVLQLDTGFVKTPGGAVKVTLTDSDLNSPVFHENELADADGNQYLQLASLKVGATFEVRVRNSPIHDANGDGGVNFQDVGVSIPSLDVIAIRPSSGRVTMIVRAQVASDTAFTLAYEGEGVQTQDVKSHQWSGRGRVRSDTAGDRCSNERIRGDVSDGIRHADELFRLRLRVESRRNAPPDHRRGP